MGARTDRLTGATMAGELSHLDEQGRAHMVDVGEKPISRRECVARGEIRMQPETLSRISEGRIPKGGIGLYYTRRGRFVHYDCRGRNAGWRGEGTKDADPYPTLSR